MPDPKDRGSDQGSLFGEGEPAMRRLTRQELIKAYAEQLKEHPPFPGCAGDVARLFMAADALGATLQIVPKPPPSRQSREQPPAAGGSR